MDAIKPAHKLLAAAAVAAVGVWALGSALRPSRGAAPHLRPGAAAASTETLPTVGLAAGDAANITRIELTRPDDDDDGARLRTITLERRGPGWALTAPIETRASAAKAEALAANLEQLHLWKVIDRGPAYYERYDLTADKALHVVAWKGAARVIDFFAGKGSDDGQLVRLPDRDGIFALVSRDRLGYAGFLYTRDLRSWRETAIFQFDPADVAQVQITNRQGVLRFRRAAGGWTGTRAERAHPGRAWPRLDARKVDELLAAYRSLSADDFGAPEDRAASGVDDAETTGGVIRIGLRGGADMILRVGKPSNRDSRWAIKDSRWAVSDDGGGERATLYALAPWTAGWATAGADRFE
jgi:hypothetical protein